MSYNRRNESSGLITAILILLAIGGILSIVGGFIALLCTQLYAVASGIHHFLTASPFWVMIALAFLWLTCASSSRGLRMLYLIFGIWSSIVVLNWGWWTLPLFGLPLCIVIGLTAVPLLGVILFSVITNLWGFISKNFFGGR